MENKTVEVDGMVYEIGKYYLFSDSSGSSEVYDKLTRVHQGEEYRFVSGSGSSWRRCCAVTGEAGTITPAPAKLVDGEAYLFDFKESKGLVGILDSYEKYGSIHRMFLTSSKGCHSEYNSSYCANITRLVPEVK